MNYIIACDRSPAVKAEIHRKKKQSLGEEHSDTVSAMGDLPLTFGGQGKLAVARVMQKAQQACQISNS